MQSAGKSIRVWAKGWAPPRRIDLAFSNIHPVATSGRAPFSTCRTATSGDAGERRFDTWL
jgi:hypothetical protein